MRRHRPHVLFLTRADSAGDTEREMLAREGLERLGLAERAAFLSVSEPDLYRCLLEGDVAPLLRLRRRLLQWLDAVRPNRIFGDAFEVTNVIHDLGRALLDSAWREYCDRSACENFELPLVCRTGPELWNLRFQEFPCGPYETIRLTPAELECKLALAEWIGSRRVEAEMARCFFAPDREVYRAVPARRDYLVPPEGLQLHYDDWGRHQVQRGKYAQPILFAQHFVPLVRQLPRLTGPDGP
jgi:hypothetical protein